MKYFVALFSVALACSTMAQNSDNVMKYRRSSIYSLMINHTDQNFANEIKDAFIAIPVPDSYNDHDLSVKVLTMEKKLSKASSTEENKEISLFLSDNKVASRLVAKWFDRDLLTGVCDMNLVRDRGLYDASKFDKILAERSVRSKALLEDAGEDLIGNTFVIVNDIRYIDRSKGSKVFGSILKVAGSIATAYTGNKSYTNLGNDLNDITSSFKGFKVIINTFLYKLEWDENISVPFYKEQYTQNTSEIKSKAFEAARDNYKLTYVAKQESSGNATSFLGISELQPVLMVRKACQRAIDENVASLQTAVEAFRVKTPIVSTNPITAYIGLKEGIGKNSRFEVLEAEANEQGMVKYNKVAIIEPIETMIWDNRYMAVEEGAPNSTLGATTFKKISGKDIYNGMLIRRIK